MADLKKNRVSIFVDDLQARGRYTFTRAEITGIWESSDVALEAALRRLKQRGRIAKSRRGFYVIVPVEYREAGCPPASWFVDDLMRFLDQPYYVGLLSAAAIHGAAHQQPMVFQVITDRPVRPVNAGRVRVAFHKSRDVAVAPVVEVQTETGMMRVSSPEATAYDLVRFTAAAGYLNNVFTVLKELAGTLDPATLVDLAPNYAISEVQRIGYLLELLGESKLAKPLAAWLDNRRYRPVLFVPGQCIARFGLAHHTECDRGGRLLIPRAHVTAWRAIAPWPTDAQVEQDLVLSRALVDMYNSPEVAHAIAFRGGTALHKVFFERPARYSEDIDLAQIDAGPIGPTFDQIRASLDPWL